MFKYASRLSSPPAAAKPTGSNAAPFLAQRKPALGFSFSNIPVYSKPAAEPSSDSIVQRDEDPDASGSGIFGLANSSLKQMTASGVAAINNSVQNSINDPGNGSGTDGGSGSGMFGLLNSSMKQMTTSGVAAINNSVQNSINNPGSGSGTDGGSGSGMFGLVNSSMKQMTTSGVAAINDSVMNALGPTAGAGDPGAMDPAAAADPSAASNPIMDSDPGATADQDPGA